MLSILGVIRDYRGYIGIIGYYILGFYSGYIGIVEKKMETTIVYLVGFRGLGWVLPKTSNGLY